MSDDSTPTAGQGTEPVAAAGARAVRRDRRVERRGDGRRELTSRQIRDLIRVSTEGIAGITSCGCDGGRCGCFGSDCPCNKVHNDKEDIVSLPEFLKVRQEALANLRTQLAGFEADDEKIKQLGG